MKQSRLFTGAFLATFLWGSAFPCVKIGYEWMHIRGNDTGGQMVFAGVRFLIAGIVVLLTGSIAARKVLLPEGEHRSESWRILFLLALTQTFLQYFFYYIGLAHVSGTKGSIMNSLGTLFTVVFGMVYFKNRPEIGKLVGVLIGMAGVVCACVSGIGGGISPAGEGALFLSAVFIAVGNIMNKKAAVRMNPMLVTGCHLSCGGLMLLATGVCLGGSFVITDVRSGLLMAYMVFISAAGFGIWSYLLKHYRVENVAVFLFLTPVFGTLMSGLMLGEQLGISVLAALVMVCAGIILVQRG